MSTFTGLRISRFFLSLRTSALFPFYVLNSAEVFPILFLLQPLQISGKNSDILTNFQQIPKMQCFICKLLGFRLD